MVLSDLIKDDLVFPERLHKDLAPSTPHSTPFPPAFAVKKKTGRKTKQKEHEDFSVFGFFKEFKPIRRGVRIWCHLSHPPAQGLWIFDQMDQPGFEPLASREAATIVVVLAGGNLESSRPAAIVSGKN